MREIHQLLDLGTFEWDWLPPGAKTLSSRLVLKVKYHADGSYDKHKARLTIRGCFQVAGRDYDETFAPAANVTTGRILDAIAVLRGWKLWQADISNAFCQAMIDVPVYFDMPRGITIKDKEFETQQAESRKKRALRLVRALYGLKQSPASLTRTAITGLREIRPVGFGLSASVPVCCCCDFSLSPFGPSPLDATNSGSSSIPSK